jgi:hypothetical protein
MGIGYVLVVPNIYASGSPTTLASDYVISVFVVDYDGNWIAPNMAIKNAL